jgi:predicted nucleic acid-binding protein
MSTFVDTNVLVYARAVHEAEKQPVAAGWLEHLWQTSTGRVSTQVLNEYYVTTTRKLDPPMTTEAARADIADLASWQPVGIDEDLMSAAWEIEDRYGFHFWDALVVAAAKSSGCDRLLTEDLQHGQDLDGLRVVNPFEEAPPSAD